MPINVFFRGPMLFLYNGSMSTFNRIIVPDTTAPGTHVDTTPRRPHYAGILTTDGTNETVRPLSGASRLRIVADKESGPPQVDGSVQDVANINEMAESAGADFKLRRGMQPRGSIEIELSGGTLATFDTGRRPMRIPHHMGNPSNPRIVPTFTVWTSRTANSGLYQIDDTAPVRFGQGTDIYVFHWDHSTPTVEELRAAVNNPQEFEDLDMKWVYSLFEPAVKTDWTAWLGNEFLPVPTTANFVRGYDDPKSAGGGTINVTSPTATCDPSSYVE